jgi:BASS family bile acid:Na+ symporter
MSLLYIYVSVLSVATLMGLGLGLTLEQISDTVRQHWKRLLWGLVLNFIVIPVAALKARSLINLEPAIFTGFFLCMAAAGGGTGSLLTYSARGDDYFSIALLFPLTLVSLVATPLWMIIAAPVESPVNPWSAAIPMASALGMYIITPLFLGMIIRKLWPTIAMSLVKPLTRLSMIMLVVLVAGFLFIKGGQIKDFLTVLSLSLVAVGVALIGGITAGPDSGIMRAMGFTTSIRNVTVAILLASTCYPDPETLLAVLIYGLAMYVVCFPVAFVIARNDKKECFIFSKKSMDCRVGPR